MNKLNIKLAIRHIATNKLLYIPYIVASSIMILIFNVLVDLQTEAFIIDSFGSRFLRSIFAIGEYVMTLFSMLFLIYMSKSISKNSYKELSLLYALGMTKKDLLIIIFIQNMIVACISLIIGLIISAIFLPFIVNVLARVLNISDVITSFNFLATIKGAIIFGVIFLIITLIGLLSIRKANPLELGELVKKGESEPKAGKITFVLSIATLAYGYYLALSIKGILNALPRFFRQLCL